MTGAHRSRPAARATLWLPGLTVALGAAAATAHGLYQVALAAAVPAGIAWLYPLITDGLALVAYSATNRLGRSAARYAWTVVITAAGLSGLAQAVYLASGATLNASPTLRFGIGAWPAVAAAHLLHLLAAHDPSEPPGQIASTVANLSAMDALDTCADETSSSRPTVQGPSSRSRDTPEYPRPGVVSRPSPPSTPAEARSANMTVTPARTRASAAALRHAERHGALPTVSVLAAAADVSRGTAATVLKPLREHRKRPGGAAAEEPQR
jgi:hypothetical protein